MVTAVAKKLHHVAHFSMYTFMINDQVKGWKVRSSNPRTGIYIFFLLKIIQTISGANPGSNGYRESLPAVIRLACDAAHSYPHSKAVKNEWSYTSTAPIYLHGVGRETLQFFLTNSGHDGGEKISNGLLNRTKAV
jgi:cytochrome b561